MALVPHVVALTRGDAGVRLDLVLRRRLTDVTGVTRTRVQRWIESGLVTVNDARVHRASTRAAYGDVVAVSLPADRTRQPPAAEDLPLDVLFEDDHVLAVNKPAGLVVHPTYKHTSRTLLNGLLWHARSWADGRRPSLVGRLDRLTSGVVLVAKTPAVHARLQQSFAAGQGEKDYLALVYGTAREAQGQIDLPLGRDRQDRRRVVVSEHGAPSVTRFERLTSVSAPRAGLTLLRCRLVTGRMHQIRVHLAAQGWPIVGDSVYGQARWLMVADPVVADALRVFPRQALHAWRVSVPHPTTGAWLVIHAPIPEDLDNLIASTGLVASP